MYDSITIQCHVKSKIYFHDRFKMKILIYLGIDLYYNIRNRIYGFLIKDS